MKKRLVSLLSLALVLCLLVSLPLSAFATETETTTATEAATEPTQVSSAAIMGPISDGTAYYSDNKGTAAGTLSAQTVTISEQWSYNGMTYGKVKDGCYINTASLLAKAEQTSATAVKGTIADGTSSYTDCFGTAGATLVAQTVTVSEQWSYSGVTYGKLTDDCWINMTSFTKTEETSSDSSSSSSSVVGKTGVINHTNSVNVRDAGTIVAGSSNIVDTIASGTAVTIYDETTDSLNNVWYKISNTEERWVISTYVKLNSTSSTSSGTTDSSSSTVQTSTPIATGMVTSKANLKVRTGAGVSNSIVTELPTYSTVSIYETTTVDGVEWGRIGTDQWVCMTYVQITSGSTSGTSASSSTSTTSSTTAANGTISNCSTGANYRAEAGISGDLLGRLAVGTRVTVTKVATASNGTQWGYADGYGWVCMTYITLDSTSSVDDSTGAVTSSVTSTTGAANANITMSGQTTAEVPVYLNADTSSTKLITLGSGQKVSITGRALVNNVQWGKVTISGNTGWVQMSDISMDYVNATVSSAQLSVYYSYTDTTSPIMILGKGQTLVIIDSQTDGTYLWGLAMNFGWVNMSNVAITTNSSSSSSSTSSSISITCKTTADDVAVYKDYTDTTTSILKLAKNSKITVTELQLSSGVNYGKVTIDSYTGWINMDNVTQDSVTGSVSSDSAVLYIKRSPYSSYKSGKTLSSGTSVTILERYLVYYGENVLMGKLIYNGAYYYIEMSDVSLGSTSTTSSTSTSSTTTGTTSTTGTTTTTTTGAAGTVVNTDSLKVRSAAGVSNTLVTTLSRGASVTVYEQTTVDGALWGKIDQGWVAMAYIDLSSNSTATTASSTSSATTIITTVPDGAVAVGFVNYVTSLTIRSGAGLGYSTVGTLTKGTNVVIYEQQLVGGMIWGRIDQGWICTSYVTMTGMSVTGSGSAGTIARCYFTANVRSSAGIGNALVGKVMVNSRVEIYETTVYSGETWGRTSVGWINMEYVLLDSEAA